MKKIRILALILALLMLPLGMLVSCKKDDVDTDGDGDDDGATGSGQQRPTTSTTTIVDDGSKAGYLCYYTFDNAPIGSAFTAAQPYNFFSHVGTGSFVFGRRDVNGRKGGYLGIERAATKANPYFDLQVMTLSGFSFTHVISFDIYLGGGAMKDDVQFVGRKGSGVFNNFLTFYTDGTVYAADKYQFFTAKASGEWVNFAVAINDTTREFDVYVNGVKKLVGVTYSNENYEGWDTMKIDRYRLTVRGANSYETEMRIDNFYVSSGLTPPNASGTSNVIYTDIYTERGQLFGLDTVELSKQKVLDLYSSNDMLMSTVKNDPYSSKLLMSSSLSLAKLSFPGGGDIAVGNDLQYDYGVETGKYRYGGIIGGKTFYSAIGKSFEFRSEIIKEGTDIGKLIVVDENGKEGTYSVEGDASLIKITIIIDNVTTYAVYADGVFKTVSTADFDPEDAKAIVYTEGAFHGKNYSYNTGSIDDNEGDIVSISFTPDEINGKVAFSMTVNDTVNIDVKDVTYAYDYGILTFQNDGKIYNLAYNAINDEFTLYDPDGSYLLKHLSENDITVSDDDILALHYQSFGSGSYELSIPVSADVAGAKPWEKFYLELYIPESMVGFKFGAYLYCGDDFYFANLQFNKSGLQKKAFTLGDLVVSGSPNIANLDRIVFRMTGSQSGTAFGPKGDNNGALGNDGHDFYIINMALLQEKIAEVEGPKDVDYCTHQAQDGTSYLEPVEEAIPSSCTSIGYYAMRCTHCKGTVIDDDKPITDALGHSTEGQGIYTQYPTCENPGYTYQQCKRCKENIKLTEIPVLAHEYHEILNNAAGRMDYQCKHCGHEYFTYLNSTLISGKEKYETLLPEGSKSFLIFEGHNDTLKLGSLDGSVGAGAAGIGNVNANPKYATFIATRVGIDYAFEVTKGDTSSKSGDVHNPYFDVAVGDAFGNGGKFVFEFDIKPGEKGNDGKYGKLVAQIIDRTSQVGADGKAVNTWINFFTVNKDGYFEAGNGAAPVQLDPDGFTNIAIAVDPIGNTKTVYINGVFATRGQFNSTAIPNLCVREIRIQFDNGDYKNNIGASYFYNSLFAYVGTSPLCLVNTDIVNESKGSLGLYETDTPEIEATPVTSLSALTADKTIFLKSYERSSEYTFSFKLSASAALANGVLLKGNKVDAYNTAYSAELLTVKDGYLYYMGVPIYNVSEGCDGVEIKLYCEDYLARVTVTVNGTEILSKRPYGTGDNYSAGDAYLRSYTFGSAVGEYSVTDISFVTTAQEK